MNFTEMVNIISQAPVMVSVFLYNGKHFILNTQENRLKVGSIVGDHFICSSENLLDRSLDLAIEREEFFKDVEFEGYYILA